MERNVNRNCLYWRCCACTVNFICHAPFRQTNRKSRWIR